ncbi:hypothetical protein [Sorangium cellulosum]|uniref:hypothetical protein n=1 Tax=Sorangium cellulosum TaxID=56 RepID=UPI001F2E600E|nr:hypothetical protein [Sorangium cellulosum]
MPLNDRAAASAFPPRAARLGLALALLLPACQGSEPPEVRTSGCPRCDAARSAGALPRGGIDECSGVVASGTHPDVLYVHNDSGDDARFFALGLDGTPRAEFEVAGATAIDWEDVARGPCGGGGGSCLYFADIGDNEGERERYEIYRVEEPDALGGGTGAQTAESFSLVYPDGSHDAETLLVHPITGALTVVTKEKDKRDRAWVYELAALPAAGGTATLAEAGPIEPPAGGASFTAGDVRPDGSGVLLRTSSHVFFYPMTPEQTVAQALAELPCVLPVAAEEQGEAIAWLPGGWNYVTLGEGGEAPLHQVSCQAP